jgi:hypothetical protein
MQYIVRIPDFVGYKLGWPTPLIFSYDDVVGIKERLWGAESVDWLEAASVLI